MSFMETARGKVRGRGLRIVYPEGREERAQRAAALLAEQGLVKPTLLGSVDEIRRGASGLGISLAGVDVRDPVSDPLSAPSAARYFELRKHKGVTAEAARA